ncbi:MAG: SDR family oxidoreductase [Alphaproteobacteria bacterium]|jgi:3-oxoacyl-[acyl-carrier protein] reductase|nr:SDR family oxidoreductase [Alphaproteobacteria bacterium]MBT7941917.1 SDR family oxidoreductase [Alphaproteobacteria bacterium]
MDIRLNGRNALITGGSLGIGFAIAERFAKSGGNVAIVARRADVLNDARDAILKVADAQVVAISGDITDAGECQRIFAEAKDALGSIDILVNNAGSSQKGPFEDITDDIWQADIDLKLFAAIRFSRLALPDMKSQRWGRIINVLNSGSKAPPAEGAPTAVTRAAGMAMTKAMACEFAPDNVLINSLHVGRIKSDQWVRRNAARDDDQTLDEFYDEMAKIIPMGRVGEAEEFANIACFLASDAGGYITGTAINVDGGMTPVV